tara:strand:+ start:4217 stop:5713 length:1497 start_codon:yes stop_codon:yes gene_type:complete
MAKKIEILENTLLKLLIRRGDDLDRKNVILSDGELGYTTDGKRLFVGDGQTAGGQVVGNVFKASVADHTTVVDAIPGDIVFNNTSNSIFFKTEAGWLQASQLFTAGDTTINLDSNLGTLSVGTLSAGNFSADIVGNSIELASGRISLSSTQIKTDQINTHSASHLKLPGDLNINSVDYTFPVGGLGSGQYYLGADASGTLTWSAPDKSSTFFFNSSSAAVPVGAMVESASLTSMPSGWLVADGQTVASAQYPDLFTAIGTTYGGNATNFDVPNESAAGFVFIKALADGVVETTLTVQGGLTASKDGVAQTTAFSLLDGAVEIGTPIPGVEVIETAGSGAFTTKATFTKVWVTGSGAKGGTRTGGAAATVFAILSAPIGTEFDYEVGAGVTTNNTGGNLSKIDDTLGTLLVQSAGATFQPTGIVPGTAFNTGTLNTGEDIVISGHIIKGGSGGWDTNGNGEEAVGASSFWGSDQAPGAGAGGHNGDSVDTSDGIVKFEW